jgi:hypothetical protein
MSTTALLPRPIVATAAVLLLAFACLRADAQEPVDNDLWKHRCLELGAQSDLIDKGSAPPELLQTTHGVPGTKFAAVGQERAHAGQHYIACTMFYTAAMAEHMGNGGKVETSKAHTDIILAGAEAKKAAGLPLSFKEKMDRTSGKLNPVGKGGLTPQDVATVYAAFGDGGGASGGFPSSPSNSPSQSPAAAPWGSPPPPAKPKDNKPWSFHAR